MPNWCHSVVTFDAPPDVCGEMKSLVGGDAEAFNMDALLPPPSGLDATVAEDWRHDHWGTKWNVEAGQAGWSETPAGVVVRMNTAWTPPVGAVVELSAMFPVALVRLEYTEDDTGFSGRVVVRGGVVQQRHTEVGNG